VDSGTSSQRRSRRSSFASSSSPKLEPVPNRDSITLLSPNDPTRELHMSSPSRKMLREISGGNVLIDDIINRIRFDSNMLKADKFTALIEQSHSDLKLCVKHMSGLECYYNERCKYLHTDLQLAVFGGHRRGIIPPGGSSPILVRIPASALFEMTTLHDIAYLEFSGKIVWARDAGRHSRELWEEFLKRLQAKISSAAAEAADQSADDYSVFSQQQPYALKNVHADAWLRIFSFLDCVDARAALIAFSASALLRSAVLEHSIWGPRSAAAFGEPRAGASRFGFLTQAAVHAHGALVSSLARFGEVSAPIFSLPGVRELGPSASFSRSAQVTVDAPICDISITDRLLACACVGELHLFNDWTKVAVARKPRAFEKVCLPSWSGSSRVVHAGSAGLFWSDLDDAAMPVTGRAVWSEQGPLSGLTLPDRGRVIVGVQGASARIRIFFTRRK
jgi:hypothetical protein